MALLLPSPLAVAVAGLAGFLVGGVWFSPLLFGPMLEKELGDAVRGKSRGMGAALAAPAALGAAFAIGVLIASLHITTIPMSLAVASLIWAAFALGINLPSAYLHGHWRLFSIEMGHKLATYLVMAAIFAAWTHG